MHDPDDITGHTIPGATVLDSDGVTVSDMWLTCDQLNAHPPRNAVTLHTAPPLSACGRHPDDWGTLPS